MLDGLFMLLSLSVVMAVASFIAGAVPLSMSLSQSQLRLISTIGMGVLVGTSLIVIIPEGIEAIYTAGSVGHAHGKRGFSIARGINVHWAHSGGSVRRDVVVNVKPLHGRASLEPADAFSAMPGPVIPDDLSALSDIHVPAGSDPTAGQVSDVKHTSGEEEEHAAPPTFAVGFSLIMGFVLMFLIDKLPRHASENLSATPPARTISLGNLSQGLQQESDSAGDVESEGFLQSLTPNPKQTRSLATTTGLVIHAAADGIAMGASASTANAKLGFIIFIAIMIHKAPAAFGLTSVLLKQGLSKRAARGHLIVFSLAAPFGALTTWLIVHILGGGSTVEGEQGQWWTGMLLLFSAGTFLYVAMHAMQEDASPHSHEHSGMNGYTEGGSGGQRKPARPQMRDTFAAVAGMLLPLLTQIGHHH